MKFGRAPTTCRIFTVDFLSWARIANLFVRFAPVSSWPAIVGARLKNCWTVAHAYTRLPERVVLEAPARFVPVGVIGNSRRLTLRRNGISTNEPGTAV